MYIIFGSKKNVYKSIPVDGIDIIEISKTVYEKLDTLNFAEI